MIKIKRVEDFRNLGIGFFIHFGLYNKIARGEWYQNMYNLTSKEYYDYIKKNNMFNIELNIKQIVETAKNNGFKYIVLTAKHHDGFCLFDSNKTSEYDIHSTDSKKDILKLFIDECIKNDIKPFIYYATLDWNWDTHNISFEDQLNKINEQIEILLTKYPKVSGFWFDGNWSNKNADWKEDKLYKLIRKHNPDAMIINNSGLTNAGKEQNEEVDSITFEQGHLQQVEYSSFKRSLAAEACQSFNDHWGYAKEDYNFKSVKYLILKFLQARREKANYLLNVSIDENGDMLPIEIETIKIFHKWINKYAYFLFDEYSIIGNSDEDFVIKTKFGEIYGFVYDLPSGGHVKVIQNGGKIQPPRNILLKSEILKSGKFIFLDNDEEVSFTIKDNNFIFEPTAFNYGFNTIVRVFKIK